MAEVTEVRERPILFSGPMVRAILDGRKTQTRRVVKPQPENQLHFASGQSPGGEQYDCEWVEDGGGYDAMRSCPYGQPGDRLWVRETWAPVSTFDPSPETGAVYWADSHTGLERRNGDQKWKPSIHMPRWACRLTLEITDVRVERLQEITEADAIAEGSQCAGVPASLTNRGAFAKLWESINGPGSWEANPWCWAISFKRLEVANG